MGLCHKNKLFKITTLLVFCLLLITNANAQKLDMDKWQGMQPRNIGPAGMSGRITAIDVVRDHPDIIYAGSASGGIWKSTSGGIDWKPIFNDQPVHSIGAIDIFQKNPSIIWVGTGEGNPRNSVSMGGGVYRSIDGGRTWKFMGLKETRNIHRIIVHPEDPDIVYVGAQGTPWEDTEQRGLYKTTDGGKTWEKILYNNKRTGIADLVMDPSNPNKLFAAMWEFRRWPWFFKSGGEGSGLYMTLNGGKTWKELTAEDGLPEGPLGRIGLAIAPGNPDRVYALVESKNNAMYRSDDGGFSWEKTVEASEDPQVGSRPFYYSEIYVDPQNENRVYSLYTYLSVSEDGGKSFESIYPYYNYIHPDHHAFYIHPDDPSFIIDGNDGGLNISRDRGETWRFVSNIPVAQYYHINVDMQIPYNVYGGMQDNGSWQGPAYVWRNGGIRNSYFEELYFGDGFDVVIDSSNARYAFAMSQRGNVGRVDLKTGHSNFVRPVHPEGIPLRFNWNAAIAMDTFDDQTVYFGSQFVHKSTDRGDSWKVISPDLTTDDPAKQKQHKSGGLTIDATGAENFTTITAIAPSRLNDEIIWAGTDDGNVQITRNDGRSWTNVVGNIEGEGVPEGSWVTQIKTSRFREGEAVVVINNYRRNDWNPYVMRTTNYGEDWENIVEGKGLEGYALSFVQDPIEPNLMFVGTEFGLYVSIDGGENWTEWENGYPTASTYDMVIHPREHDLVIGTFGRSAWILDDIRPLREVAQKGIDELDKKINIYPAPDAYLASVRQAAGIRFAADGMFHGENRPFGARLTYSVVKEPEVEKADDEEKEEEKVIIEIFNSKGDKIRTLKEVPEHDGINRTIWELDEKGVRGPSRRQPDEDAPEPSGSNVLPGTYKVKMTYGGQSDSTTVQVHFDPRISYDMADLQEKHEMMHELMSLQKAVAQATNQLLDAKEMIEMAEKMIKSDKMENNSDQVKILKEESKAVKDSVVSLLNFVLGKEAEGQGVVREPGPTVASKLRRPRYYIQSSIGGLSSTERVLMDQAREAAKKALEKINDFFNDEWPEYVEDVEGADLSPFKQFEIVKLPGD
ncbi:MAG TPA: hypothetical protein VF181_09125 [Balneolaceae bacterium]